MNESADHELNDQSDERAAERADGVNDALIEAARRAEFEQQLVRAAAGDSAAWRVVVNAFAPRVHGLLRAQCRDDELAEEITQSTFCTIATKLGSYIENGRFEAWLFRIAMNRLRDEMRRRARQARTMDGEAFKRVAGASNNESGFVSVEVRDQLRLALSRMTEADREIIDLRHIGGLSFRALSDFYEEPVGTLLARHHRALKKLKAMLVELGVGAEDLSGRPNR
ncbi:MAG: sigma-70 family RNA polymerase sigma factor [Planctomycetota bacterium]|nr:MAG: sigma-70 family RNA polymerase sigma factor [Planctomycetota bacterium]